MMAIHARNAYPAYNNLEPFLGDGQGPSVLDGRRVERTPLAGGERRLLERAFLAGWLQIRPNPALMVKSALEESCFSILVEDVFTEAESILAELPLGASILRRHIGSLVDKVSTDLVEQVEAVTGKRVISIDMTLDVAARQVISFFNFGLRPGLWPFLNPTTSSGSGY